MQSRLHAPTPARITSSASRFDLLADLLMLPITVAVVLTFYHYSSLLSKAGPCCKGKLHCGGKSFEMYAEQLPRPHVCLDGADQLQDVLPCRVRALAGRHLCRPVSILLALQDAAGDPRGLRLVQGAQPGGLQSVQSLK